MLAIALDLGGSHVTCGVVRDRDLIARRDMRVNSSSFHQLLPDLENLVSNAVMDAGVDMREYAGITFGFPGIVDSRTGRVIATNAKFNDAIDIDLPGWARSAFDLPLLIENDARLALLGEQYCGAARGAADVVLVALGTGIGAAAMLGGKPLRGRYDQAGCLGGHLPVVLGGRQCTCGNLGCAEAEASTWALPSICRTWRGFEGSKLTGSAKIDFAFLYSAADEGDSVANEVLQHCYQVWGSLAVALIHAYSPEVLLFSGGVMIRGNEILPPICAYVHRHAWSPRGAVEIKASALESAATIHGAIPLLKELLV
jgi:glucokinase